MRKPVLCLAVCLAVFPRIVSAQVQDISAAALDNGPAFEVASIKPAAPGAPGMSINTLPGGRVVMTNVVLRWVVTQAWDIRDYQLAGAPGWFETEHFDIVAKPDSGIAGTAEGLKLRNRMIQALITERCGMVFHWETRELPVYAMVVARNGPRLAMAATPEKGGGSAGRGRLAGKAMQTSDIAKALAGAVGRPVVDQTGLTGEYDYTLKWTPDPGEGSGIARGLPQGPPAEAPQLAEGPSIFTAIREQLGLRLESRKVPGRNHGDRQGGKTCL